MYMMSPASLFRLETHKSQSTCGHCLTGYRRTGATTPSVSRTRNYIYARARDTTITTYTCRRITKCRSRWRAHSSGGGGVGRRHRSLYSA